MKNHRIMKTIMFSMLLVVIFGATSCSWSIPGTGPGAKVMKEFKNSEDFKNANAETKKEYTVVYKAVCDLDREIGKCKSKDVKNSYKGMCESLVDVLKAERKNKVFSGAKATVKFTKNYAEFLVAVAELPDSEKERITEGVADAFGDMIAGLGNSK